MRWWCSAPMRSTGWTTPTLVDDHLAAGAAVTMVTTRVDDEPERYGVVQVGPDRVVRDYRYKPEQASGNLICNEVFAFDPRVLVSELEHLAKASDEGLEDLGTGLLPDLVEQGSAREYRFDGFWRDLGTVDAYWQAHMDFLPPRPKFAFADPELADDQLSADPGGGLDRPRRGAGRRVDRRRGRLGAGR